MKKVILLFLTLGTCAAASVAAADDLKDNSLQIDNSRLEKEEELHFGAQSEQIKALFNEADQKKLLEMQNYQDKQLITERGQLFSAIEGPVRKSPEEQLFQADSQKLSKLQTNLGNESASSWSDFLPGVLYTGLVLLLIGVTGIVSYRVATAERD
ncbi:type VII secretion protein EssA [Streptococcus cristatus]|uniref:Type VII secretion protein EssA n=1 Tax=Streptococcus cristatus TaxID=45634 RepID=A0A139N5Z0_STRCR|nr:type VII secretion protein EssA [Streptococcus cristatus]KXT71466.1 hypothetical protein SCRDD08_00113 [Streptococcus cristatus]